MPQVSKQILLLLPYNWLSYKRSLLLPEPVFFLLAIRVAGGLPRRETEFHSDFLNDMDTFELTKSFAMDFMNKKLEEKRVCRTIYRTMFYFLLEFA